MLDVLHVHPGNLYGGVETALLTLATESRDGAHGLRFTFAVCFRDRFARDLEAAGARVLPLGPVRMRSPLSMLRARRRLREVLARESFDVAAVHSPWSQAIFGGALRGAGVPLAFFMHGPAEGGHWIDRLAARLPPDFVVYNSAFTRASARLFAHAPGAIVYLPVPLRPAVTVDRPALRRSLGARDEDVVILQASRMEGWKGHALHLAALAELRTERPWRAWFAGGPQRPAEERLYTELRERVARDPGLAGRVSFLGQRSDVPALMAAADVFCQPNTGPDPFGLVFVEALRARLPVVTTAMGGALEIVDDTCGRLVPPTAGDVARALGSVVDDEALRARLGAAGPARASALTDPGRQIAALADVLRPLARKAS